MLSVRNLRCVISMNGRPFLINSEKSTFVNFNLTATLLSTLKVVSATKRANTVRKSYSFLSKTALYVSLDCMVNISRCSMQMLFICSKSGGRD
jgi:hypothetical protein